MGGKTEGGDDKTPSNHGTGLEVRITSVVPEAYRSGVGGQESVPVYGGYHTQCGAAGR